MGSSVLGLITTVTGRGQVLIRDLDADTPRRDAAEGLYQDLIAISDYKRNWPRELVLPTAYEVDADWSKKYQLEIYLSCPLSRVRSAPDQTAGSKPKAIDVDFLDGRSLDRAILALVRTEGVPVSVNAAHEVVIAAGTFNTP